MPLILKIAGEQETEKDSFYRLSNHCIKIQRPEGLLLYHVMTKELLLLSPQEAEKLKTLPCKFTPQMTELVTRWFLRPLQDNDCDLVDQIKEVASCIKPKATNLSSYTIFTTTDCNARCFYCFERGSKKISMTPEIAYDVAGYIIKQYSGKTIQLRWFGGEPLLNSTAIDIITSTLQHNDIDYRSSMISNGYLFDSDIIKRAKEKWKLQQVQITLDGTEDVYNYRKAYWQIQGSAYRKVINNIHKLLEAQIKVIVRLNMDDKNEENLYSLCDELADQFSSIDDFYVYLAILLEDVGYHQIQRTEAERDNLCRKSVLLRKYLRKKKLASEPALNRKLILNRCMADNDAATTITPEGFLGCCEHYCDKGIWGSIYSETVDWNIIQQWKVKMPIESTCYTCPIYPVCVRLKQCPGLLDHCTKNDRALRKEKLFRSIIHAFELWKEECIGPPG